MRCIYTIVGLGMLLALGNGCQNQMADERDKLYRQNQELQAQLSEQKQRPAQPGDSAQLKALQDQIAQRDAEIARLKNTPAGPGSAAGAGEAKGLEGLDTTIDPRAGTITVNLASDVLFDSGKATLKDSARATLDKVAAALNKEYAGKAIRVEGHTDTDPITRTRDQWTDNLDLSLARAATVTRYLEKAGVDPKRLVTSGYGEFQPKGNNKAANRRVEIVVVTR